MLVAMMSVAAWAVLRKRVRTPVIVLSLISVAYFGFFRKGCVCSIGSIQNMALALTDSSCTVPITVLIFFVLPLIFALFFGRVFCSGVCLFGAMQDLVNVRNYRLSKVVTKTLGLLPWIYLAMAVMFAVTRSGFIICRYDPFIGIFRFGGDTALIVFGALLLVASVVTGRPFCRFLCPYGALLSLFSRVAVFKTRITVNCINCDLCRNSCPVDAVLPPYENRVGESRAKGVRRILNYLILLPLIMLIGALLMRGLSGTFSRVNKTVRLYEMVSTTPDPRESNAPELVAFYGSEGNAELLKSDTEAIVAKFKTWATVSGAFIGLVVALTLIGLSLKRTRKKYEIDHAACVSCARCFGYCPQNQIVKQ